ncbi:ArsR/SmtB family transcription factor [Nesterenkonia muleiensis]|uniref:ArsR/SmtB family transcription factor n=1 Tax=Nesterenkonia muleiensis TaxID=2282648 RepID=UPI000E76A3D0|nr:helix-turn-helix domain-containing protein [Nesterenkonia muleiensis]
MSEPAPQRQDPARDETIRLDARSIRGIAHPLRVQILGHLRIHGPTTATRLAQALSLNSDATSYHLRQLSTYGFVVEEQSRGVGRERWWKAAHTMTDASELRTITGDGEAAETYLRSIAQIYAGRMHQSVDEFSTMPPQWRHAATLSDYFLSLTPEEAEELGTEITELLASYAQYRLGDDSEEPGRVPVSVQYQILPVLETPTFHDAASTPASGGT